MDKSVPFEYMTEFAEGRDGGIIHCHDCGKVIYGPQTTADSFTGLYIEHISEAVCCDCHSEFEAADARREAEEVPGIISQKLAELKFTRRTDSVLNEFASQRDTMGLLFRGDSRALQNRLRHEFTNYDSLLRDLDRGRPSDEPIRLAIKEAVDSLIENHVKEFVSKHMALRTGDEE